MKLPAIPIVIAALVLIGVCLYAFIHKQPTTTQEILMSLKNKLSFETTDIKQDKAEWIENYQKLLPLTGQSFNNGKGQFRNKDETEKLGPIIKSFFSSLGFSEDKINTINALEGDYPVSILSYGYTKGDIKCLMILYPDSDPGAIYFCGELDNAREKLREEFTPLFYPTPLPPDEAGVINVNKITSDYATGTDDRYKKGIYEPSGASWIATKVKGNWVIVFDGQDYPKCSAVDKYMVPIDIYKNCIEDTKGNTLRLKDRF